MKPYYVLLLYQYRNQSNITVSLDRDGFTIGLDVFLSSSFDYIPFQCGRCQVEY